MLWTQLIFSLFAPVSNTSSLVPPPQGFGPCQSLRSPQEQICTTKSKLDQVLFINWFINVHQCSSFAENLAASKPLKNEQHRAPRWAQFRKGKGNRHPKKGEKKLEESCVSRNSKMMEKVATAIDICLTGVKPRYMFSHVHVYLLSCMSVSRH